MTVFLISADVAATAGGGRTSHLVHAAHAAVWADGPVTQQLENRSTQPLEAIVVELKME